MRSLNAALSKKCVSTFVLVAIHCCLSIPRKIHAAGATIETTILFEGNRIFTTDQLRAAMSPPGEPSHATHGSNTEALEQGLHRLREFLIAEGYVTARLGTPQRAQGLTGLVLRVAVEEGPLYRLGEVKVTGATVFSEAQIIEVFDLKQGDTFKGDAVRIWFERLKDLYANAGYLDWTPIPRQEIKEPESASSEGTVNLTIDMDEGSRL